MGKALQKGLPVFENLELDKQVQVLLNILILSRIGTTETDLTLLGEPARTGNITMNKKMSIDKETYLIHQSVTGIYEKQVNLLTV